MFTLMGGGVTKSVGDVMLPVRTMCTLQKGNQQQHDGEVAGHSLLLKQRALQHVDTSTSTNDLFCDRIDGALHTLPPCLHGQKITIPLPTFHS